MTNKQLINKTAEFVKQRLMGEGTGHDWWHVERVWKISKTILKDEPSADKLVAELAALLHDIADWKFHNGDIEAGPREARKWLEKCQTDEEIIQKVEDVIRNTSFKGARVKFVLKNIETKIVSDADKIDALGAIGIARTFAYGGSKNQSIYDPNQKPTLHKTFEEYKKNTSPTINHFYEKLLLLKDLMQTKTGRKLARRRHKYMEKYLDEFFNEWNGKI